MRHVTWLTLLAGLIVAFGAGVWATQTRYPGVPGPTRDMWEYQVVTEPTPGTGASLNRLGATGWEVVSALVQDEHSGNTTRTQVYYVCKRRMSP